MTLGGAFPSALGWDRCSGSPARWWTEPPVGENRNVSGTDSEAFSLKAEAEWKGCHLWHDRTNVCGLRHFASVWKEILVSLRGLPRSPCFHKCMGGIFCAQNTQSNTIAHTHTHTVHTEHEVCVRKWEGFTSRVKTKQGRGLGLPDCFLKCKGANVQKFANVRKMSPHLNTAALPPSPPCRFLPQPFRLMCLPSAHLTAAKLPFFISPENVGFLAFLHLRRN